MDISPTILRLHPELDADQRAVVAHTEGPLMAIAGPGSGKTLCVELRALNPLLAGQSGAGDIVLRTFGRDAARELRQRFTQSALRPCAVGPTDTTPGCGSARSAACATRCWPPTPGWWACDSATPSWTKWNSSGCCAGISTACWAPTERCSQGRAGGPWGMVRPRPPGTLTASETS